MTEPWFGTWPPELYGGDSEIDKGVDNVWGRLKAFFPVIIVGVALIGFSVWPPTLNDSAQIAMATLGATCVVVAGLGITVDWWLKKSILDDVVKASLGYVLPDSLKPAMRWVYNETIICKRHEQSVEIASNPKDPETVIVTTTVYRVLKNMSSVTTEIELGMAVDEWFEGDMASDIIEFGYRVGDTEFSLTGQKKRQGRAIVIDKVPIQLQPEGSIDTWFTQREVKRLNDDVDLFCSYATENPTVSLRCPDNIDGGVGFAVGRGQNIVRCIGDHKWVLGATLLPHQVIKVRWWDKRLVEAANE